MQRRDFSHAVLAAGATAIGVAGSFSPRSARAQVGGFKEGTNYQRLGKAAPVDSPAGQIEVVEFFAYSCIHCFNFEPVFNEWMHKVPSYVTVKRVPVAFSEAFVPMQRLYYALEAMDLVDKLHEKVFQAIHVEKLPLTTPDPIVAWVGKQGVDSAKFTSFYNSFAMAGKAKRAIQLQDAYQVEGTPALGVAGKYYVGGQGPTTLRVADALIAQLRKS
ncbi:thiol:disulfide interchange protein DsbA/DsbL [Hydrogenophaga sp.]|uniref:thiol:disulfide interchange protein DsbA/DsbL n=1 Tax=Hydrogenophaga sp. TaxID=1904254 RepID=UPI00356AFD86